MQRAGLVDRRLSASPLSKVCWLHNQRLGHVLLIGQRRPFCRIRHTPQPIIDPNIDDRLTIGLGLPYQTVRRIELI